MERINITLTTQQLLSLIKQLSLESKKALLSALWDDISSPDTQSDVLKIASLDLDNFNEEIDLAKYSLKIEDLLPLRELFENEPSAEELISLIDS